NIPSAAALVLAILALLEAFMRSSASFLVLAFVSLMTACGSDDDIGLPDPSSGRRGDEELASAEEVAENARGDVDCPADIDSPDRPDGAPVDDVVGVRPGLTYDEALNVVLCTDEMLVATQDTRGFNIQTYGQTLRQGFSARFAEAEKSSQQIMKEMQDGFLARSGNAVTQDMLPGQSKWYVATMGLPGKERVISVAREEWFAEGKSPTQAAVAQALIAKYGAPSRDQTAGQRMIWWIYDPRGRLATETSPLYQQCTGVSDPDGGTNFSPDCGLVVHARIMPLQSNPDLAQYMQVGVIDQAGGYQAITGTEQALAAGDAERQARETREAAENADAPQL
ncbi:MAG TPA: hypothetical protein VFT98_13990, partial [Myxococcota bacterium]|nr:hypothetical protein [Myxococcota bacterium]